MHLSNFPECNWGVILQQAWSVYLKDRIHRYDRYDNSQSSSPGSKKKEICKRFNKGKCNKGFRCNFDHRCLECGKFGHGAHICRNKTGTDPQRQGKAGASSASGSSVSNVANHAASV